MSQPRNKLFFSVPSQYSNQQKSSYYDNNKLLVEQYKSVQQSEVSESYQKELYDQFHSHDRDDNNNSRDYNNGGYNKQVGIDLQNLNIQPIENKNGDMFYFQQNDSREKDSFKQSKEMFMVEGKASQLQNTNQIQQSQIWIDVFYSKKSIMGLLQQRNQICQFYKLNSKNLKQNNQNIIKKRIYTDSDLSKYIKQLFSESPSYQQYDHMSFAIIPQITTKLQTYYVFLGTDQKYVPLCKWCNISAYLILNIQSKIISGTPEVIRKNSIIKGRILCSNLKCKKKGLGEFVISNQDKNTSNHDKNTSRTAQLKKDGSQFITKDNNNVGNNRQGRKSVNSQLKQKQKRMDKNPKYEPLGVISQKQKMLIKKAVMRVAL